MSGLSFGIGLAHKKTVPDRILIVEDDAVLRKHLGRLFAREGYEVTTAASRADARIKLDRTSFEVLLLDVMLPDGDGLELLADVSVRQRPPQIVVMTAFATPEGELRARSLNVCRVLPKPLDLMELLRAVRRRTPQFECVLRFCGDTY